jgi:hypothetical protein
MFLRHVGNASKFTTQCRSRYCERHLVCSLTFLDNGDLNIFSVTAEVFWSIVIS